jgi:hypothetical protein
MLVGTKGKIIGGTYGNGGRLIPEAKMKEYQQPPVKFPRSPGQHEEWLDACKGGKPAGANFDYAGPLTELVLLGTIAMRVGQPIEWDPQNMKVTNVPDAEQYVMGNPYREGWKL